MTPEQEQMLADQGAAIAKLTETVELLAEGVRVLIGTSVPYISKQSKSLAGGMAAQSTALEDGVITDAERKVIFDKLSGK